MLGLIQRVSEASVTIDGEVAGTIDRGLLLLLGIEKADTSALIDKLMTKVIAYRIFPDDAGNMNLSLVDIDGGLLIVPQFTLAADTTRGLRPSFSAAAKPSMAEKLYDDFVVAARARHGCVETGRFGADMKVRLLNDGPVTFLLA
ncbi:MAG: D-aminoacyl-tRNA deacylase, partial [Pseudomonadales bacterium]